MIHIIDIANRTDTAQNNGGLPRNIYLEKLQQKYKAEPFYDYVIQPNDQHNNLIDAINLILDFNESIQLDLV